jgi:hypothetical protein
MYFFRWYRDDKNRYFFIVRKNKYSKQSPWPYVIVCYIGDSRVSSDPWTSTKHDYEYIKKSKLVDSAKIPNENRKELVKSFFEFGNWIIK